MPFIFPSCEVVSFLLFGFPEFWGFLGLFSSIIVSLGFVSFRGFCRSMVFIIFPLFKDLGVVCVDFWVLLFPCSADLGFLLLMVCFRLHSREVIVV